MQCEVAFPLCARTNLIQLKYLAFTMGTALISMRHTAVAAPALVNQPVSSSGGTRGGMVKSKSIGAFLNAIVRFGAMDEASASRNAGGLSSVTADEVASLDTCQLGPHW